MKKEELMEQVKNALKDESVVNELKTLKTPQDVYDFLTKKNILAVSYEEFMELGKSLSIVELIDDDDLENVAGGWYTTYYYTKGQDAQGNPGYIVKAVGQVLGTREGCSFIREKDWEKWNSDNKYSFWDATTWGNKIYSGDN